MAGRFAAVCAFSAVCFLAGALHRDQHTVLIAINMHANATSLSDLLEGNNVTMDGFSRALALAVGTGMDNFAVGAAYGCRGRRVERVSNLLIAGSNAATTLFTMLVGSQILRVLSVEAASQLGACIFLVLGVLDLKESLSRGAFEKGRNSEQGRKSPGKVGGGWGQSAVGLVEAVPVALGLCFTHIAGGLAAGAAGLNVAISSLLALVCSIVLLSSGHFLGTKMNKTFPADKVGYISGLLLLALGCSQLEV